MRYFVFMGILFAVTTFARSDEGASALPAPTRWALDAGYGYRLWESSANLTPAQSAYEGRAKSGLALGGEVAAFPWNSLGLGLVFTQFYSAVSGHNVSGDEGESGISKDAYVIRYAGPAFYYKRDLGKFESLVQVGPGIFFYNNDHESGDSPGVLQGRVPGIQAGISFDYRPFRHVGLGVTARAMHGIIKRVKYNGIPFDLAELNTGDISLTRADLTLGLRFYP